MFVYFYIQGCYYAASWYDITIMDAVPYFGDIMSIITDPEFVKASAMEIILFIVGLAVAAFANPTSKKNGRKSVQQNDVFITPLSTIDTGFSGADAYNPFGSASTQNPTAEYNDPYGTQNSFGTQSAYGTQDPYASQNAFGDQTAQTSQGTNSDWVDVYAQNSDNNNNSTGF